MHVRVPTYPRTLSAVQTRASFRSDRRAVTAPKRGKIPLISSKKSEKLGLLLAQSPSWPAFNRSLLPSPFSLQSATTSLQSEAVLRIVSPRPAHPLSLLSLSFFIATHAFPSFLSPLSPHQRYASPRISDTMSSSIPAQYTGYAALDEVSLQKLRGTDQNRRSEDC